VPLARAAILDERDRIEELAELLEGAEPVDARGVAFVGLLLSIPVSPIYGSSGESGALEDWLDAAVEALERPPADLVW
jgi:hypothetical protein